MRPGALAFVTAASGLLVILAGCRPPMLPQSPVQSSMHRRFALARELRTYVISADLEAIRSTAAQLATADETWGLPPGTGAFVRRIHAAAGRAAEAEDLPAATTAIAQVAAECGACHLATDVALGQRFTTVAPLADGSTRRHMNRLAWVSRLLWDGLVGPSDLTWRTGAEALAAEEGFPDDLAERVPPSDLVRAEGRLRELGGQASSSENPADRIRLMAQVWGVCAGCHAAAFRPRPD